MGNTPHRPRRATRELIISVRSGEDISTAKGITNGADRSLKRLLTGRGATLKPTLQKRGHEVAEGAGLHRDRLARFHRVLVADDELEAVRDSLSKHPAVEAAYIKPAPVLAANGQAPGAAGQPVVIQAPVGATQDFSPLQAYLLPAPGGVDAQFAWTCRGGRGDGVKIIDCEWNWDFTHEALQANPLSVVVGTADPVDADHGTAVIGTLVAGGNGFGTVGVCPNAVGYAAAFMDDLSDGPTSAVITKAADFLGPGDILLIVMERPGPALTPAYTPPGGNAFTGTIPFEWWPDDFAAIAAATAKGIIVVEAAGNGGESLDDPVYNSGSNFPSWWNNPFAAGGGDSGAILVGAGCPPPGTHGRTVDTCGFNEIYVDRARCGFSNYGARVDCQAWGYEVTALGFGDLQNGITSRQYTNVFNGTSSASPIIAGVLACAQGALRAAGRGPLAPSALRNLLRSTGSPQQEATGRPTTQRIGNRPDLREIFTRLNL
jgi:hypothetical protein